MFSTILAWGSSSKEDRVQAVLDRVQLLAKLAYEEAPHADENNFKKNVGKKVSLLLKSLDPEEIRQP